MEAGMESEEKRLLLELQNEAGVIDMGYLIEGFEELLPDTRILDPLRRGDFFNISPAHIMRALGINPALNVVVGHPNKFGPFLLYGESDGSLYSEGYNTNWYFLIKCVDGEEELHRKDHDYHCRNTVIAPHNNNPEEGKAKILNYFELLEKHKIYTRNYTRPGNGGD